MEAIGLDMYNQSVTGDVAMTVQARNADKEHIPCLLECGGVIQ